MISEKTSDEEHLLTAWVIHFSLAGCTTSVFREKLQNPSNIHIWETTTRVESNQFDFIYFLTQLFLTKDIETLQRIILEPEEIHELVEQTASVRKSLNESGELDEASYRTEIDSLRYVRCNFVDERCISIELLVTDLFDPDHNLRDFLIDLRSSRTVTRNEIQEGRDSFCVTSHNPTKCTRDKKDAQSPCFQKSKESRRKGSRNRDPTDVEEDIITSQTPFKSQIFKSAENNSPQTTPKKSRKRRISSCHRKSFNGKIPKMNTIDTYFKPVPRKTPKMNTIDTYFKPVPTAREKHDSVIDELHSSEIDCFQDNSISLTGKAKTSVSKPIERAGSNTDICMTGEILQDCHAKQVTELSASNEEKLVKDSTLTTLAVCSESLDAQTTAKTNANNIDLNHNVKNKFKLDAATRNLIRDWCGGDTFLTQESFSSSEEVMEQDNRTTDDDDDDDYDNVNNHHSQNNNDKIDDDDDDDNVINRDPDDHKGHGDSGKCDTNNDKSADSDDSDDDSGNDDDSDEDYIYISDDESDSEDDDNYKKAKKRSFKRKKAK